MIDLEFRSYTSGKVFRPKPLVLKREESGLMAVITPWGPKDVAEQIWQKVYEVIELPENNLENPFFIPGESRAANRLVHALRVANEEIFQNENQKQLRMGFEVLLLYMAHGKLAWARVGQPHLVLFHQNEVHPLSYQPDWGWHFGNLAPLPSQSLGAEPRVAIQQGLIDWRKGDAMTLVSRSYLPKQFFAIEAPQLKSLAACLIDDQPDVPFWLAVGR